MFPVRLLKFGFENKGKMLSFSAQKKRDSMVESACLTSEILGWKQGEMLPVFAQRMFEGIRLLDSTVEVFAR